MPQVVGASWLWPIFMARNVLTTALPIERNMDGEDVVLDKRSQPGDRVRIRVATKGVAVGTLGTVQIQFASVVELYQVLFDGELYPNLMRWHELESEAEVRTSSPHQARW